jgi:hypothetical protein
MTVKTTSADLGDLARRYVAGEYGRPDCPVKVTVHFTANLRLVGVSVEPVSGAPVVEQPPRPRRRPQFDAPP